MAEQSLAPSILRHLFKNGGIGPEINDDLIDGGHADDASKLTNSVTITLTGDASGSVDFDGSSDVSINVSVAEASKLASKQSITFTGDTTGSFSFDGSAAVTTALSTNNATKWDSATKYVSTGSPSGGSNGDIWFQYIS